MFIDHNNKEGKKLSNIFVYYAILIKQEQKCYSIAYIVRIKRQIYTIYEVFVNDQTCQK